MKHAIIFIQLLTIPLASLAQQKNNIEIRQEQTNVTVLVGGLKLLTYHTSTVMPPPDSPSLYQRSGFIHPLYSPSGNIMTDDFPSNHAHQHALFHAWTNNRYKGQHLDFWNQHLREGTVRSAGVTSIRHEKKFSELRTRQEYVSLTQGVVLEEIWTIKILPQTNPFAFELTVEQRNVSRDTLFLEKHIYGGMAFRGSKHWDPHNKTAFQNKWSVLTDKGLRDSAANHTAAKWVTVSGRINGKTSYVTVKDHPENFRHPQKIRVHPDMPYWAYSPVVDGPFFIAPGGTYKAVYSYTVGDGEPINN
jgi:hypothetical protein